MFDIAWDAAQQGHPLEYVTGNSDADAVYRLHWVARYLPQWQDALQARLRAWGGNASGLHVTHIDNIAHVHPDTMWWHHDLGDVRKRPFSQIWPDTPDPLMVGLKRQPRPVTGRCGACAHLSSCDGNTRVRAQQVTGDPWAEDPGCRRDDAEIGLNGTAVVARKPVAAKDKRIAITPC